MLDHNCDEYPVKQTHDLQADAICALAANRTHRIVARIHTLVNYASGYDPRAICTSSKRTQHKWLNVWRNCAAAFTVYISTKFIASAVLSLLESYYADAQEPELANTMNELNAQLGNYLRAWPIVCAYLLGSFGIIYLYMFVRMPLSYHLTRQPPDEFTLRYVDKPMLELKRVRDISRAKVDLLLRELNLRADTLRSQLDFLRQQPHLLASHTLMRRNIVDELSEQTRQRAIIEWHRQNPHLARPRLPYSRQGYSRACRATVFSLAMFCAGHIVWAFVYHVPLNCRALVRLRKQVLERTGATAAQWLSARDVFMIIEYLLGLFLLICHYAAHATGFVLTTLNQHDLVGCVDEALQRNVRCLSLAESRANIESSLVESLLMYMIADEELQRGTRAMSRKMRLLITALALSVFMSTVFSYALWHKREVRIVLLLVEAVVMCLFNLFMLLCGKCYARRLTLFKRIHHVRALIVAHRQTRHAQLASTKFTPGSDFGHSLVHDSALHSERKQSDDEDQEMGAGWVISPQIESSVEFIWRRFVLDSHKNIDRFACKAFGVQLTYKRILELNFYFTSLNCLVIIK